MSVGSLVILAALVLAQGQTAADQSTAQPSAADSVAGLAADAILALGRAGAARDVLSGIKLTGEPLVDGLATMTAKRQAISRILEGRAQLKLYQSSATPAIRETAEAFDIVFLALEGAWRRSISLDERLLHAKTHDDLIASVSDASKIAADAEEAWRALPLGVAALTHSLLDSNRTMGGKIRYLQITSAERAELIASTQTTLPKSLLKGDQHPADASARIFREWLSKGWKTSDER
jgi:hypothetical protein